MNNFLRDAKYRFCKNKMGLFGLFLLTFLILAALIGPYLNSYTYNDVNLELKNSPPSFKFWFGTDAIGRDVFTRTWWGARISLSIGIIAAIIDVVIGVIWGSVAAFFKNKVDEVMMRICDILNSIPYLLIVILLIMIMGPGYWTIIIALTTTGWINMARIVRGASLQILSSDYIKSAIAMGASRRRIIFCHMIPNVFGSITATATLTIPLAIFTETFLSFLGLGIQAPVASWGVMINDSLAAIRYYPWRLIFPAVMLSLTMFSLNILGDSFRDVLDPRLRK